MTTMMTKESKLALLKSKFGYLKPAGANEYNANCPFCVKYGLTPNKTYKLGINIAKDIYHCFRCDSKGSLSMLFPVLATFSNVKEQVIEKEGELEPLPVFQTLRAIEDVDPWGRLVYKFLHDRNFPPYVVEKSIFFVEDYRKNNYSFGPRLLFPIYQSGTYRGFQARTIYKNTDPKYIGATNMDRKSILYNYDKAFSQDEQLVLTEGFFDQMRVGDTAVATLGKIITETQIRLIRLGNFKKVISFLDKDAYKESMENAKKLSPFFPSYIAVPTAKDPGEMTREEIKELFDCGLERVY